jgi:tetratricopeptide (TPR) repeat protein
MQRAIRWRRTVGCRLKRRFSVGGAEILGHISRVLRYDSSGGSSHAWQRWFAAGLLLAAAGALARADTDTNGPGVPAWTNLVIGRSWGTNTQAGDRSAATNATGLAPEAAVREELRQLLAADDAAQAEADRLLQENARWRTEASGASQEELQLRLRSRFIAVRSAYQQLLTRHPDHVEALLAYGGLLNDLGEDAGAAEQWEKARSLAPENPATWNNLANHYAGSENELKAFSYYEKAIALATNNAAYQRNLGFAIINLRSNAMSYYSLSEVAVLEKGLQFLRAAEKSLPDDFALATEIGQTLYAIRPLRTNELVAAWTRALEVAGDDVERQGVSLHLARAKILAGQPKEAQTWLAAVTNAAFAQLKRQLETQLTKPATAGPTNAPTARP